MYYSTYDFVRVYIPIENYLGVQETTEIPKLSSFQSVSVYKWIKIKKNNEK